MSTCNFMPLKYSPANDSVAEGLDITAMKPTFTLTAGDTAPSSGADDHGGQECRIGLRAAAAAALLFAMAM